MPKLKIVWLCHFTNNEIQGLLPMWKKIDEFASWIPNIAKGFEYSDEVELHIISPHEYLKYNVNLLLRNVHYHFIPVGIPVLYRHWPNFFRYDIFNSFQSFRSEVTKQVKQISPDLINLIGAENAYYSSAILDFHQQIPVLVTIQGFVSQFKEFEPESIPLRTAIEIEQKILYKFQYFCGEQDSSNYISQFNPNHVFFKFYFPVNEQYVLQTCYKTHKFDCIFFGRITKVKGAEDFLYTIAEIKKEKEKIKACMVGSGNIRELKLLAQKLKIDNNITFLGFVKTQKELFEYIIASKVFIAPPHKERLSSTIREAMFLKVPIVAYATGGISYINEFDKNILLVPTGDYVSLAENALVLLRNEKLRVSLAEKAFNYGIKEYSLKSNYERLISAYKQVIFESKNNEI